MTDLHETGTRKTSNSIPTDFGYEIVVLERKPESGNHVGGSAGFKLTLKRITLIR